MSNEHDFLSLLHRLDDPMYAEFPPNWDREAAELRFIGLAQMLKQRLGIDLNCEVGTPIQDASFHGSIDLPRSILAADSHPALRVSNFDSLATIYGDDSVVRPDAMRRIISTLEQLGYLYIPSHVLDAPYSGDNPGVNGFRSWLHRYFDWT